MEITAASHVGDFFESLFIQLRAQLLDADSFLKSAYDPYAFMRDAWRQTRLNKLYDGNPPADVMLKLPVVRELVPVPLATLVAVTWMLLREKLGGEATPEAAVVTL